MCISIFAIGTSLVLISFAEDIKYDFNALNRSAKVNEDRLEVMGMFSQLIKFHSNVKELSEFELMTRQAYLRNNSPIDPKPR